LCAPPTPLAPRGRRTRLFASGTVVHLLGSEVRRVRLVRKKERDVSS